MIKNYAETILKTNWYAFCPKWTEHMLLIGKDIDVNEHERLFNITLKHKIIFVLFINLSVID